MLLATGLAVAAAVMAWLLIEGGKTANASSGSTRE
jgi:hypothetical protein